MQGWKNKQAQACQMFATQTEGTQSSQETLTLVSHFQARLEKLPSSQLKQDHGILIPQSQVDTLLHFP